MTIHHPSFKDLSFEAEYIPAEQSTGERNYSLGSPPEPARYEIKEIYWQDRTGQTHEITDFVYDYCDFLFQEFQEDLAAH